MKGIDTLPPGPVIRDYDFRITYYEQPIDDAYKPIIVARLTAGMPPLMAVKGTPVTVEKAKRLRKHLKLTVSDEKRHFKFVGKHGYDGYDVMDMFYNKKMSLREIAKHIKCSKDTVHKALKAMDATDMAEFRRKNPSVGTKKAIKAMLQGADKRAKRIKNNPGHRRYVYFLKKHGHRYLPLYKDIENGMPVNKACKKHGISYRMARHYFRKFQKLDNQFLEFGKRCNFKIKVTKAVWYYWEKAAKRDGINMLDWIKKHLNAAATRNARDQSGNNRPETKDDSVVQGKDARGEVGTVLQGVRPVHERPASAKSCGDCAGIADGTRSIDALCPEQGLGADAATAKVDHQHRTE